MISPAVDTSKAFVLLALQGIGSEMEPASISNASNQFPTIVFSVSIDIIPKMVYAFKLIIFVILTTYIQENAQVVSMPSS